MQRQVLALHLGLVNGQALTFAQVGELPCMSRQGAHQQEDPAVECLRLHLLEMTNSLPWLAV